MDQIKFLNSQEKKEIIKILNEQLGIKEIPGILLRKGVERLYLFNGSLSEKEIQHIEKIAYIERAGVYFARQIDGDVKLSLEGVQILKDQITKNIFEITDEKQAEEWMQGHEINIQSGLKGFVAIKFKGDFLGTGKASSEKITNFIPKSRRLHEKNN